MKKTLFISGLALLTSVILFSCEKKKETGIGPGYKEETGTGLNPNPNPTVTGASTNTNPATSSSFLQVGGTGWSNPTCASTSSVTLKGINGQVDVTMSFFLPPTTGTYQVASAATQSNVCSVMVQNAPNQPAGTVWFAKSGMVSVTSSTSGISATFATLKCYQQDFNFPEVTVSGNLNCGN
jgi:hypothetical protein